MNAMWCLDDDAEVYRFFGYGVVSPRDVRQAIADNPEGETLTLEVNSGGGNMFAGYEIYTILKAATIPTEVKSSRWPGRPCRWPRSARTRCTPRRWRSL